MEPYITIVIPVYKIKPKYLRECANSIIQQSDKGWKAIFIDDGSPDNCGEICDEFAEMDSRISVIHQKNQGVSVARNVGIEAAETEWVTFIDPDDWVETDMVESLRKAINSNLECDIFCFDYWREYVREHSLEVLAGESKVCTGKLLEEVRRGPFYKLVQDGIKNPYAVPAIWNKVYRKNFLNENGIRFLQEARKGQDRLFNSDALLSTNGIYYLHKAFYHYRCYGDSITNRFNENIFKLTCIELKELERQLIRHNLKDRYGKYLNCRICTRLYSCMRLYYFNEGNPLSEKERIAKVKALTNTEPFSSAIKMVDSKLLSLQERVFVSCLRFKCYRICSLLVKLRAGKIKRKLN